MTRLTVASRLASRRSDALAVILGWLALSVASAGADGGVNQIEESGRRADAARSIQHTYVRDLGLRGKTAAQTIEILLGDGFRCGLRAPDDVVVFKEVAMRVRCIQDHSKLNADCPTLMLSVNARWSRMVATRSEMLDQLSTAKIKSVIADCPPPLFGSAEYIVHRRTAEELLEQQASQLALVGTTGKQAFDRLIADGFDCGLDAGDDSTLDATLACQRIPSRIEGCFGAELVLDMRWKKSHRTPKERVRDIKGAIVQKVRSQCALPRIEGDQSAYSGEFVVDPFVLQPQTPSKIPSDVGRKRSIGSGA